MAKNKIILICLLWFNLSFFGTNHPKYVSDNCVKEIALSQVGVREIGGNNRGEQVEKYLKTVGLKGGNSWCAAFVKWLFVVCEVKNNITAWSPTTYNKKDVIYTNGVFLKTDYTSKNVLIMSLTYDKFIKDKARFKGIGHCGFVYKINMYSLVTIEGNTNDTGARDSRTGDGVFIKKRPLNNKIHITRWQIK